MAEDLKKLAKQIAQVRRDMKTLEESLDLNRLDLPHATQEELRGILEHGAWILEEHDLLKAKLRELLKKAREHDS
jgi:hypothetical protein